MKVLIPAAGSSTRLKTLTEDKPKCLLTIGNTTILGKQISNLEKVGLKDVVIMTGFKSEKIEEYVSKLDTSVNITLEYNPFFDISNNMMSLWSVRHLVYGNDIMIINGDNIFDYKILKKLLASKHDNVLMVQQKDEYDGDDMKVQTKNGRLYSVNKVMKSSEADGESIGVMKFSKDGAEILFKHIEKMSRIKENLQTWYLKAIEQIARSGINIYTESMNGLQWEEVDFHEDYEKVSKMDWE